MKNKIRFFLIILILIIMLNVLFDILKKEHQVNYKIKDYDINEKFYINNKKHYYNYVIKKDKEMYIYSYNKDLDKEKNTINSIIDVNIDKNIKCIMPIYSDNNKGNVECLYNNKLVSLLYLKNNNNKLYNQIINKYNKLGFNIKINSSNKSIKYKNINIYKDNIKDKYNYIIWDYKGIYIVNNKESKYKKLLNEDKYENDLATVVDRYYVYMNTNKKYNGFKLYTYDIKKDKIKEFSYKKDNISDNIYFNGVYKNMLYVYDKDTKLQFKYNPKFNKFDKVGNKVDGFYLLRNNKFELTDYYDYKENIYFNDKINNKEINKLYKAKMVYLYENYYYILSNDNNVYKVYKDNINKSLLLFKLDNVSNFYIKDNNLFLISNDYLYVYNDDTLLNKIIRYKELNYNNKNICDLYIEK